ncbi:MAG: ComEC/Rec2 family competence protein, partial [Bacteroidota bacterium]
MVLATVFCLTLPIRTRKYRWVFPVVAFLCLFTMGHQLVFLRNESNAPNHFQQYTSDKDIIIGTIVNMPVVRKQTRLALRVEAIHTAPDGWQTCSGNLLLYLEKDSSQQLQYGDQLLLHTRIQAIEGPKNPYALDFRQIYHAQNLHYQAFAKLDEYRLVARNKGHPVMAAASGLRRRFIETLRNYLGSGDEFAVASALILGYKNELTPDLKNAYANTGAIHILAVSGMHVGILLLLLRFLLNLPKLSGRWWNIIYVSILLCCLWSFALITGFSASVVRAVFMFSLIELARLFSRSYNIYNVIFASAFCLLLYNPFYLLQPGFQLSYLAVLGIVYF